MIYTEMTKLALRICFDAHKEQVDKSGLPYVFHPFHLAEEMKDEDTTVVALLHDVIEDSELCLDDLVKLGFSDDVIEAISLLTHDKADTYMEYVEKLSVNSIARAVKLADLKHNSDLTRLDVISERDISRRKRYEKAIAFLEDINSRTVDGLISDAKQTCEEVNKSVAHKSIESFVKEYEL